MSPHIKFLIEERKIVRILKPQLCLRVQQNAQNHPEALPYLLQYEGQVYLSLQPISDRQQREQIYNLLQKLQLGQRIDLTPLPRPLRRLIQPHSSTATSPTLSFVTASCLSAATGIISGILGMAIGVLAMTITGLTNLTIFGMGFTAVSFIISAALGWIGTTVVLWSKTRPLSSKAG